MREKRGRQEGPPYSGGQKEEKILGVSTAFGYTPIIKNEYDCFVE